MNGPIDALTQPRKETKGYLQFAWPTTMTKPTVRWQQWSFFLEFFRNESDKGENVTFLFKRKTPTSLAVTALDHSRLPLKWKPTCYPCISLRQDQILHKICMTTLGKCFSPRLLQSTLCWRKFAGCAMLDGTLGFHHPESTKGPFSPHNF